MLSVIGYHFRVWKLSNDGYLGVDIFFVISGYLITLSLMAHSAEGLRGLAGFYARRVRRILPAATVMTVSCLIAAVTLCFPIEVLSIGHSATFSALFLANVYFGLTIDYFGPQMEALPLIHMWSLSVEEQFYVAFPLLLIALRGGRRRLAVPLLGILAAASLAASIRMGPYGSDETFYFVQYRAWELLLGALVALGAVPEVRGPRAAAVLSFGGLLLIAGSVLQAHRLPIPGATAVLPCLGAAAIIHAGRKAVTWPGRMLGFAPLRFIGLISYSLYLWHWPLLVFYRLNGAPAWPARSLLILTSFAIAVLSWRFVERPFLERPWRLGTRATLVAGVIASMVTVGLGLSAAPLAAYLHPTDAVTRGILAAGDNPADAWRNGSCFINDDYTGTAFDRARCMTVSPARPNVLIVGDSHAADLWHGFATAYPQVHFLQATASRCRPLIRPVGKPWCTKLMRWTFGPFLDRTKLDAIILSGRWRPTDLEGLAETARALGGRVPRLYVLGPIVEYDGSLPRLLAAAPRGHEEATAAAHRLNGKIDMDRRVAAAVAGTPAIYISTYRTICPAGGTCRIWSSPGKPLQFDYGHLTPEGATVVAKAFAPALDFARAAAGKTAIRTAGPDLSIQTATKPH